MSDARAKKNVAVLAVCQGLLNSTMSIMIALGGIVGYMLADDKSLATLPVTAVVAGTAIATVPASFLMRRVGRRAGFMSGAILGLLGALLASIGVYIAQFWIVAVGSLLIGMFAAFGQYYRFAAADVATEEFRSKAISLVMAGGVIAGFLGPELAKYTKDLLAPYIFMGSYMAVGVLSVVTFLVLILVDIPKMGSHQLGERQRPLGHIMRQPTFLVAALSAMVGYGVMSLIMTATPLAMIGCGFQFNDAATVIQWHVVGMFAPSFFTGHLINRLGVITIILIGTVLAVACVIINLSGIQWLNFWSSLILLGIAWNFMFIGGTTLLTSTHSGAETAKVQAVNDFLVFGTVATASLLSGQLLDRFGWETVNFGALPFLVLILLLVLWFQFSRRVAEPVC